MNASGGWRGEVRSVEPEAAASGLVVIVGREALARSTGTVVCVPVRERPRGLPSEVPVPGAGGGVAAADEPLVVAVEALGPVEGRLGPLALEALDGALRYALDVPGPVPGRLQALTALAD